TAVLSTPSVENPGLPVRIFSRLRTTKPAPTSSTKLSDTWTTTRAPRTRALPRAPTTLPDSDLSAEARSTLLLSSTGTIANNTVETRHTPALSTSTRQSIWPGKKIGPLRGGIRTTSRLRHQYASRTPPAAPITERV